MDYLDLKHSMTSLHDIWLRLCQWRSWRLTVDTFYVYSLYLVAFMVFYVIVIQFVVVFKLSHSGVDLSVRGRHACCGCWTELITNVNNIYMSLNST